jgi:2,4-dienoyl-CoA reductase-like NADH-dependent reductase (Old Yellow Enzyme family)
LPFSTLFSPLAFRSGLELPHRVALAPMTNMQSHADGTIGDDEMHWLLSRADGGFALIPTCAAHVAKDGQGWSGELGVFDDRHIDGLARLAGRIRDRGAAPFVQLFHGGMRADPKLTKEQAWSATAQDGVRAATVDDLARVIEQFGDAAARAQEAGMEGVEVHGAHGYLLTQFLSRTQNLRDDAWGGALENRARVARAVVRRVRERTDASFTVGVRISPEDFGNAKGLDLDESIEVARWLAEDGADFIHLSLWRSAENTKKRPDAHALPLFRAALPEHVRIFVAGQIWTPADADRLLSMGADVVALGRSAIANPDWPMRARDAAATGWEPRRPPLTVEELRARALSPPFAEYMRQWKGFVA